MIEINLVNIFTDSQFLVTIWIPRGIKISHSREKRAHTEKDAACVAFKENLQ
jgi:hypothetical protein